MFFKCRNEDVVAGGDKSPEKKYRDDEYKGLLHRFGLGKKKPSARRAFLGMVFILQLNAG
jgi:hypothetical protein